MDERRRQRAVQRLRARYAACVAMGLREEASDLARTLGLSVDQQEQHFRAGTHALDTWQPEVFEEFDDLPPGRFDARVFDQTTYWVDIVRQPHRITDRVDFTDDHLCAVLDFIQREAWRWAPFPDLAPDDIVLVPWFLTEAARRMEQTPLVRALRAESQRRGLRAAR